MVGGLGSAVAEILAEEKPTIMKRIGIEDKFGQSENEQLLEHFGLTAQNIAETAKTYLKNLLKKITGRY